MLVVVRPCTDRPQGGAPCAKTPEKNSAFSAVRGGAGRLRGSGGILGVGGVHVDQAACFALRAAWRLARPY